MSVTVKMGTGERTAEVVDLATGPAQVLIAEPNQVHLQSVTFVRAESRQILKPPTDLQAGRYYAMLIAADGKATGKVK